MLPPHPPLSPDAAKSPSVEFMWIPPGALLALALACTPAESDDGPGMGGTTGNGGTATAEPTSGDGTAEGGLTTSGSTGADGETSNSGTSGPETNTEDTGPDETDTEDTEGSPICPLPSEFSWTSTGPLAQPSSPPGHDFRSLKDFTVVRWNEQYIVYATAFDANASWTGVNINFSDWPDFGSAPQTWLQNLPVGATVAPQLMYFSPKDIWVLTYQWGFKYATSKDPSDPTSWTSPSPLLMGNPTTPGVGTGPIDQTVICDDVDCYIFFAGDDGHIYRGSMPIDDFPGAFSNTGSIMSDTTANLFEGVEVYSVRGFDQYLMIVEAIGAGGRYFRAFTADSLDGDFTPMAQASSETTPFAGGNNVTFMGNEWTNDISHGDIVREDPSETKPIDACNIQFLYQGRDPSINVDYGLLPYRPGLLTMTN